jgi:ubiquinone/menaquinone biosynthesis C-methylase UbiE
MTESVAIRENVQEYYGKVLQSSKDLQTTACCSMDGVPPRHRTMLNEIAPEVLDRFYGCGSPLPEALDGCTVLDLGCGTGRDAFLASQLVGEAGHVYGVDMTEEQLEVARRHLEPQMERFGFAAPNVTFTQGYIEDLADANIADNSIDVVISNCVINLSPDKPRVFSEIFRALKPGGEMYISDVFADRRLPEAWSADPVLHGECLGGAMYVEDFRRLMTGLGCLEYRVTKQTEIQVTNDAIKAVTGNTRFYSITVRAFKLAALEDRCEDYGQVAYYLGTLEDYPTTFALDDHHIFETGRPMLICGNTAAMLQETRFAPHFRVEGNRSTHYGLFECAPDANESTDGGCC